MSYRVKEVLNEGKSTGTYEWNNDSYWTFKVSIEDGTVCEVSRKSDTPPDVGQEYEVFEHKNTDYPPKLKKPVSDFKGGGKRGSNEPWDPYHPKQKLIVRQSAIKAAVEMQGPIGNFDQAFQMNAYNSLEGWINWFETKIWESVGGTPASSTGTAEGPAEGSSSSGNGGEPSGAPTVVDILKARLDKKVDTDTFTMLLASVGADSVQATTEEQRAELLSQLTELAA